MRRAEASQQEQSKDAQQMQGSQSVDNPFQPPPPQPTQMLSASGFLSYWHPITRTCVPQTPQGQYFWRSTLPYSLVKQAIRYFIPANPFSIQLQDGSSVIAGPDDVVVTDMDYRPLEIVPSKEFFERVSK